MVCFHRNWWNCWNTPAHSTLWLLKLLKPAMYQWGWRWDLFLNFQVDCSLAFCWLSAKERRKTGVVMECMALQRLRCRDSLGCHWLCNPVHANHLCIYVIVDTLPGLWPILDADVILVSLQISDLLSNMLVKQACCWCMTWLYKKYKIEVHIDQPHGAAI